MSGSAAVCSFCGDSGAEDKGVFMICKKCDAVKVLAERQGVFWHVQSQRYAYCGKPPGGGLKLGNIPRISFVLDFHGVADLFEAEELAKVVDPSTAIILSHVKPTASMRLKKQEMLVPYIAAGFDCWL